MTTETPTIDADEAAAELARLAGHPDVLSPPPVQVTRNAQGIDAAVALLSQPDGTLEDACMLLRRLATADLDAISTDDPAKRLQGLCAFVATRLREQFSDVIRTAPPAGLAAVVDEAKVECRNEACEESFLPWNESCCGFCSDDCEREQSRRES